MHKECTRNAILVEGVYREYKISTGSAQGYCRECRRSTKLVQGLYKEYKEEQIKGQRRRRATA